MALRALVKPMGSNPRWKSISDAVARLFELKRYPELATNLALLNENVSVLSKSDLGPFISDYYQEHILAPCMEKLRLEVSEERDAGLISKMADIWVQFYTSILPTLLAIFASVQPHQNKLSIRSLTLITFRDFVVLKTKLAGAIQCHQDPLPPQIQQMLLILQSVHRSPPDDRFFVLQDLVNEVVESYLPMVIMAHGLRPPAHAPREVGRSGRAGTMDILESGGHSSTTAERGSGGSIGRRHSLGRVDSQDQEDPVTRL